jgi:hypothetical protein
MNQEKIKEETVIEDEEIKRDLEIYKEYLEIQRKDQFRGFQIEVIREGKEITSIKTPYRKEIFPFKNYTKEQQEHFKKILTTPIEKIRTIKGAINKGGRRTTSQKKNILGKRLKQVKLFFPELFENKGDLGYILN